MRSRSIFAMAVCLLAGCNEANPRAQLPSPLLIDRIERKLAEQPCVAPLARWERHYRFAMSPPAPEPAPDRQHIDFDFIAAGSDGFHTFRSRRIIEPFDGGFLYDGGARVAAGRYDTATGALTVNYCGSNFPQTPDEREQIDRMLGKTSPN